MHDVLRARVVRKIESLPEVQVYQVLDYIEFLESRYASAEAESGPSGLQRFAEGIEDRLRNSSFNPSNLREAFQVVAAADRALGGVARAGRQLMEELAGGTADAEDSEPVSLAARDPDSGRTGESTDKEGSERAAATADDSGPGPGPDAPHDR